jgi:hypothetical protein
MTYIGEWSNNEMNGYVKISQNYKLKGVFRYIDGRGYEGQWKNNYMHGHGTYTY